MKHLNKAILGIPMILLYLMIISCEKKQVPVLTTAETSNITGTTATSGGTITDEGSGTVIGRGVCWSTGTSPTIDDEKTTDGAGAGTFTSNMTGLNGGTNYYVRAYASNSVGTGYGMAMSFTTLGQVPTITNSTITNITTTGATLNGSVNSNYFSTIVTFEYGSSTSYGQSVTATQSPVTGNAITTVSASITGLTAGTTYHIRIKAVNSLGTTYSIDATFVTLGQVPTITTLAATNIISTNATLNGSVNANHLSTIVTFEYGTTTSYGSTATATQSPVTGSTNTAVSSSITGLTQGTIYHFRIKAVNSLGTSYGDDLTFTTTSSTAVTDVDGNTYNTVKIGIQVWMAENLKTTKYNDGTPIPNITDGTVWAELTTPAYCWYNNDAATYKSTYGALYNWYVVNTGSNGGKNVCPRGWHVPSDDEWTTLTDYLTNNGYGYGGSGSDIAKSMAATSGWTTDPTAGNVGNDQASNNSSGFTAFPNGVRYGNAYIYIGLIGGWWSSTESTTSGAWDRRLANYTFVVYRSGLNKQDGFSVRCLRD